jgi:dienelactone hydrolase
MKPRHILINLILMLALIAAAPCYALERTIFYRSGALKIQASVFAPTDTPRAGTPSSPARAVILFNHGGISGLIENSKRRCRELAAQGYVVFASSFRGEDRSEGAVEVALGEVDDVLAAISWLNANATQWHADPKRVALLGFSHGALISLQAAKRSHVPHAGALPAFRALVFCYGVSDVYSWVEHLRRSGQFGQDALTQRLYGTGPKSRPAQYAARHGLSNLAALPANLPVLIVQGERDAIVPAAQARLLEQALQRQKISVSAHYYAHATHGFLIRREALKGAEKLESDQAWQTIYAFLAANLGLVR